MIKAAIIGVGGYGNMLLKGLESAAGKGLVELAAAADTRLADMPDRTDELKRRGVTLYDDAINMLDAERGRCEVVYIAAGIPAHCPLVTAAAGRGFHIHLEKPPAATVEEVDEMIAAVDAAGVLCLVGFQWMYDTSVAWLKDQILAGRIGRVQAITCISGWPRPRSYYERNGWAGRMKVGDRWVLDGPAMNAMAHQINLMLRLAPPQDGYAAPVAVRGEMYAAGPIESHDTAGIEIRTDTGATLRFLGTHCSESYFGPIMTVRGERGEATWGQQDGAALRPDDGSAEQCDPDPKNGRIAIVEQFVRAAAAGDASGVRCRLRDGRNMVLALDGAYESSRRVHRIDASFARRVREGTPDACTIIDAVDDRIHEAAESGTLFSDLPTPPPWAVATAPFELDGYERFPQRFTLDG